jgi:type III restriction enzyme
VSTHPFALATALSVQTNALAEGIESGNAPLLEQVTPTTAELLRWWFQQDYCDARPFNFHKGQRQALLNVIVAHEVLNAPSLPKLYEAVAKDALLEKLEELGKPKHAHPKYCMKLATGTGKTWIMQALMVWQLFNALETPEDERFTRNFLVVAPGLIVYDRLLDAFMGRLVVGRREFETSDIAAFAALWVPDGWRERLFQFVQTSVAAKTAIGRKVTGGGIIALTNWHLLAGQDEEIEATEFEAPGMTRLPEQIVAGLLPLTPGVSAGNALDTLDARYARGSELEFLAGLPRLMAFNDEAHHIHALKSGDEDSEVEWQKSLLRLAEGKGRRFAQVDFSATPYNETQAGRGKNRASHKTYFPHIVVDFDLPSAMRAGLVKALVLDKRRELGALPLDFKAERDESEVVIGLSDGQKVMLRAGLTKLRRLETEFAKLDPNRYPKMLVVCEDTTVTTHVEAFVAEELSGPEDVLRVDSNRKGEVGEKEWAVLREKLFGVDKLAQPRVIVSVLMLREGFDVSNICVIVPLRASQAGILLEQTIGRGLRLMWREPEFNEIKAEARQRIRGGQEPGNLIDVLTIVEHPAFEQFYEDLKREGLVGEDDGERGGSVTGDVINVELIDEYARYDFAVPFVLRDAEEVLALHDLDVAKILPYRDQTPDALRAMLGKGDSFRSQDLLSQTLFGEYRVQGAVMTVQGYNDWLARVTRRIALALNQPLAGRGKTTPQPHLQIDHAWLAAALDVYLRGSLFGEPFDPMMNENWRLLTLDVVVKHIVQKFALAVSEAEETLAPEGAVVIHRSLSEVDRLPMRESSSLAVNKCIYSRLPFPTRSGGLEKLFIEWASRDGSVEAFCKIAEHRHEFMRLPYLKLEGLPGSYSPDFLVRTESMIFLVETKAQGQIAHPNVQRKLKAAQAWCRRINDLDAGLRSGCEWHYALAGEQLVWEWNAKGGSLAELLAYARVQRLEQIELSLGV